MAVRFDENPDIQRVLRHVAEEELVKAGIRCRNIAVRSVHEPGKGVVYGRHQASAPGDPFASDTGITAASITSDDVAHEDAAGVLYVRVGSNAVNARILELGGMTGRNHATYIAPRPYLRPALNALRALGNRDII